MDMAMPYSDSISTEPLRGIEHNLSFFFPSLASLPCRLAICCHFYQSISLHFAPFTILLFLLDLDFERYISTILFSTQTRRHPRTVLCLMLLEARTTDLPFYSPQLLQFDQLSIHEATDQ